MFDLVILLICLAVGEGRCVKAVELHFLCFGVEDGRMIWSIPLSSFLSLGYRRDLLFPLVHISLGFGKHLAEKFTGWGGSCSLCNVVGIRRGLLCLSIPPLLSLDSMAAVHAVV